jgi:16S rRNA G1207 methylase RsmC
MENSGFCKEIIMASGTILLEVDKENFKVLKKLQKLSCTKIVIGDFIVWDDNQNIQHLFDKDLTLKSMRPTYKNKFRFNADKTKITTKFTKKHKLSYLVIENEIQIKTLNFVYGKEKFEIGSVVLIGNWHDLEVVKMEDFLLNYKVVK